MAADDSDQHHEVRPPARSGAGWRIHWAGVLPVAVLAIGAYAAWGMLSGDADGTEAAPPATTAPSTTVVRAQRPPVPTVTWPATVTTPPPTTEPAAGPSITAWGEVRPCRFGERCLAVSFAVSGFDPPAERFSCVYPNSTREFGFDGTGKLDACLTGDEGDVVTIRIGDVASNPVSADELGAPPAGD